MVIYRDSDIISFSSQIKDDKIKEKIPVGFERMISHLVYFNRECYYYKLVDTHQLINELIGCQFAKILNLESVEYKIGKMEEDKYNTYVLSKVFFEENYQYKTCYEYFKTESNKNISMLQTLFSPIFLSEFKLIDRLDKQTIIKLLKLIALDLKMGQMDRNDRNILLKIDKENNIDLAPIFDYGESYYKRENLFEIYSNSFITIRFNKMSFSNLFERFPELREYIDILKNISLQSILKRIEEENNISFTDGEIDFYQKQDLQKNKVLKKIELG